MRFILISLLALCVLVGPASAEAQTCIYAGEVYGEGSEVNGKICTQDGTWSPVDTSPGSGGGGGGVSVGELCAQCGCCTRESAETGEENLTISLCKLTAWLDSKK